MLCFACCLLSVTALCFANNDMRSSFRCMELQRTRFRRGVSIGDNDDDNDETIHEYIDECVAVVDQRPIVNRVCGLPDLSGVL